MRALVSSDGSIRFMQGLFVPPPGNVAVAVPPAYLENPGALVWNGTALVDRDSVQTWYRDPSGNVRAYRVNDTYQPVTA